MVAVAGHEPSQDLTMTGGRGWGLQASLTIVVLMTVLGLTTVLKSVLVDLQTSESFNDGIPDPPGTLILPAKAEEVDSQTLVVVVTNFLM